MAYTEFEIINRFFRPAPITHDVILAIGDDAALLQVPQRPLYQNSLMLGAEQIFASADGSDCAAHAIGILAIRAQNLARTPRWLTLNLMIESVDERWLESFSDGLHTAIHRFQLVLVGGDTCQGPTTICLNLLSF